MADGPTLIYIGLAVFVAAAICVFLLRDRKSKSLDKLRPRALDDEFRKQREARNG